MSQRSLVNEMAVIDSVARRDREAFRVKLIEWIRDTNQSTEFKPIKINLEWPLNRIMAELDDARIKGLADLIYAIETEHLRGYQLSILPEIKPYWIENKHPMLLTQKAKK